MLPELVVSSGEKSINHTDVVSVHCQTSGVTEGLTKVTYSFDDGEVESNSLAHIHM